MNTETKTLALAPASPSNLTAFACESSFEAAQRMARALCSSNLVPASYQGQANMGNCLIALELSQRIGASPLMVMQSMTPIHGKPSWSSQFIIAALNSCGRFSPIRFAVSGEGDERACFAWAVDKSGERLEGPAVSIATAKKEGWFGKNGSKWQTMPELMLRYRAAAFFGRLYAPDILMGMQSVEEITDVGVRPTVTPVSSALDAPVESKEAPKKGRPKKEKHVEVVEPAPETPTQEVTDAIAETPVAEPDTAATDDNDIFG